MVSENKNYYARHQALVRKVKLSIQKEIRGARVFDRHVGLFYTQRGTPIKINIKGMSDLWSLINSIHFEIEVKTGKAGLTKEQRAWQKFVEKNGGVFILARCEKQVVEEIKKALEKI